MDFPLVGCYNAFFSRGYLQEVTDRSQTITNLSLIATTIAKSPDFYLAVSIARLV